MDNAVGCVISLQTVPCGLISFRTFREMLTSDTKQPAQPHIQVQRVSLAGTVAIHEDFANETRIAIISLRTSRTASLKKEEHSSSSHFS